MKLNGNSEYSLLGKLSARDDCQKRYVQCQTALFLLDKIHEVNFLPMTLHICSVFAEESRLINAKSQGKGKAIKQMGVIVCLQQKNCVMYCSILRISVVLLLYLNICSFTCVT